MDTVTNVNGGTYSASYDADGNMVTRDGSAIQWTPSNLPSSIAGSLGTSTFNYDPDGARYYQSATLNGVTTDTVYVGALFEVVYNPGTNVAEYRHNIVADGQVIAIHTISTSGAASTDYLHYDHLGSINAITDATGAVIQQMSFDAFGQRRIATNWDYGVSQNTLATLNDDTNRGYTDQEELDNLSLVDMNGRVYDPTVGRFISADPIVPTPLFSQAFNRYSYVYNSPLEYVDPSGFKPNWSLVGYGAVQLIGAYGEGEIGTDLLGVAALGFSAAQPEAVIPAALSVDFLQVSMSNAYQGTQNIINGINGQNTPVPDPLVQMYGQNVAQVMEGITFVQSVVEDAANAAREEIAKAMLKQQAQEMPTNQNPQPSTRHTSIPGSGGNGNTDSYPGYGGGGGPGMLPPSWEVNPPQSGGAPSYNPPPAIQLPPVNVTPSNSNCKPTDPCM